MKEIKNHIFKGITSKQEKVREAHKKIDALLKADTRNILEKISDFLIIYPENKEKLSHPELRYFWCRLIQKHGEILYQLNLCQYPQTYQTNIEPFLQLVGLYKCALLVDAIQEKMDSNSDFAHALVMENINKLQNLAFNYQNVDALKLLFQYYLEEIDKNKLDKQEMDTLGSFMVNNIPQKYFTPGAIMIAQLYQVKTWRLYNERGINKDAQSFAEKCIFHWYLAYHLTNDPISKEYIQNAYDIADITAKCIENIFNFMDEDSKFKNEAFEDYIERISNFYIDKGLINDELDQQLYEKAIAQAEGIVHEVQAPLFDRDNNKDDGSQLEMKLKQAFNFIFHEDLPDELKINQKMIMDEPCPSNSRKRRKCSFGMNYAQFFPRMSKMGGSSLVKEEKPTHSPEDYKKHDV